VHAIVARSTFASEKAKNTSRSEHFWKLRCRKSARRCGAKHIWKPKCTKHTSLGPLLEVDVEKSARHCGAKHVSQSKVLQIDGFGAFLGVQISFCVAGARDSACSHKWAERAGFVAFPKTMASVGHLQRIWKDEIHVAGTIQETYSSEMFGGQGADILRGVAFWSIRSSGLLR